MNITNPNETKWQLWYEDTFDRETPRQVEARGQGLVQGLLALWQHHLRESVTAQGGRGFSRFNLWLVEEQRSISISGEWGGQVRLREWVYRGSVTNDALLYKVALKHSLYALRGATCEEILTQASACEDQHTFEAWLDA